MNKPVTVAAVQVDAQYIIWLDFVASLVCSFSMDAVIPQRLLQNVQVPGAPRILGLTLNRSSTQLLALCTDRVIRLYEVDICCFNFRCLCTTRAAVYSLGASWVGRRYQLKKSSMWWRHRWWRIEGGRTCTPVTPSAPRSPTPGCEASLGAADPGLMRKRSVTTAAGAPGSVLSQTWQRSPTQHPSAAATHVVRKLTAQPVLWSLLTGRRSQ